MPIISMQERYEIASERMDYDPVTGEFTWRAIDGGSWANRRLCGKRCGTVDKDGYRVCVLKVRGKSAEVKLHRLAWLLTRSALPDSTIDHINQDRTDNRPENLRAASREINSRNRTISANNTSGATGVSRSNLAGLPWRARFRHNGAEVRVGYFATVIEAETALRSARERLGYHQNHGSPK